jgi:pimeloyl-ACP methyl ester carboxylesterase
MAHCLYLHGFASGPGSHKAAWLGTHLARHGVELEVPDLNAGDFSHLTLTRQMAVLDALLAGEPGPVTLIGSSFGGYLAALLAEQDPRVERLVLLAPAFGFGALLESLFGAETMARWQRDGSLQLPEAADAAHCTTTWSATWRGTMRPRSPGRCPPWSSMASTTRPFPTSAASTTCARTVPPGSCCSPTVTAWIPRWR